MCICRKSCTLNLFVMKCEHTVLYVYKFYIQNSAIKLLGISMKFNLPVEHLNFTLLLFEFIINIKIYYRVINVCCHYCMLQVYTTIIYTIHSLKVGESACDLFVEQNAVLYGGIFVLLQGETCNTTLHKRIFPV